MGEWGSGWVGGVGLDCSRFPLETTGNPTPGSPPPEVQDHSSARILAGWLIRLARGQQQVSCVFFVSLCLGIPRDFVLLRQLPGVRPLYRCRAGNQASEARPIEVPGREQSVSQA